MVGILVGTVVVGIIAFVIYKASRKSKLSGGSTSSGGYSRDGDNSDSSKESDGFN